MQGAAPRPRPRLQYVVAPILSHVLLASNEATLDAMQPEPVQRHRPWPVVEATVQSDKLATAQEVQNPRTDSAREASRTRCKAQEPQSQQDHAEKEQWH